MSRDINPLGEIIVGHFTQKTYEVYIFQKRKKDPSGKRNIFGGKVAQITRVKKVKSTNIQLVNKTAYLSNKNFLNILVNDIRDPISLI